MEPKVEVGKNLLCMACLCVERTLHEHSDGRFKQYYLDCINEIPLYVMPRVLSICWECEAMFKKAVQFKEQVKDSYRILQTYTSENLAECLLSDISRPPRGSECIKSEPKFEALVKEVRRSTKVPVLTPNEESDCLRADTQRNAKEDPILSHEPLEDPVSEEEAGTREPRAVDPKHELKVELALNDAEVESERECATSVCSESELEVETKLQEFLGAKKSGKKSKGSSKNAVKRSRKVSKKVRKADPLGAKAAERKILTVKLSYEEMMTERRQESEKEMYKKAAYKCESCLLCFSSGKAHRSHVASKHSPELGKYSCPICSTVISTVESFTEHCKRHFRRYECTICLKRTMDKKTIEQHYFTTHEISLREYRCNQCGKVSNSIDSHRYHRDTHKARVQCPDCEKTFSHRAGLMNHRLAVHELQNTFPCTVCDKVFRWRTSLKRHLEKHDLKSRGGPAGGAAFCATCAIEFSSLCSYRRHLRNSLKHVTRDQLKFICDHCNKRFADKTKLRDHIEEKHLHRVYHCQICNKATKNRVGLDQHVRYVHRGRPNSKMCHYCGKGFPTKVQLESHIRTHTGERPFICEYCPTTFSQKSNLYKHNRQVHLNIKSKRHPLCKKRREESKATEPNALLAAEDVKQPEGRAINYSEQLFGEKMRNPHFTVDW
ncbi:unnamed protein product, partial [Iphiclides podalirius]